MAAVNFASLGQVRADALFSCGFETSEGYSTGNDTIAGHNGWLGTTSAGTARSGIDPEATHGVAGIGNAGWLGGNTTKVIWAGNNVNVRRPLVAPAPYSYAPVSENQEVIHISALVGIKDSATDVTPVRRDNFELFVMNGAATATGAGDVLAAIQFDNTTLTDGSPAQLVRRTESSAGTKALTYVSTGGVFIYDTLQLLSVRINFRTNLWTAALDGLPLFTDLPFYNGSGALNLGAVGFRMFFGSVTGSSPNFSCTGGDNYLLFDDVQVQADPLDAPALDTFAHQPGGPTQLSWPVEAGYRYQVFASPDLDTWSLLNPSTLPATQSGLQAFTDSAAAAQDRRFYKISRSWP